MGTARPASRTRPLAVIGVMVALGAAALLVNRARGDDAPSPAAAAEQRRTCASLLSLSALTGDTALLGRPGAAPAEVVRANLAGSGTSAEAIVGTAPGPVRADVGTLVNSLLATPADPARFTAPAFAEARERLATYLADPDNGCQAGTESGGG